MHLRWNNASNEYVRVPGSTAPLEDLAFPENQDDNAEARRPKAKSSHTHTTSSIAVARLQQTSDEITHQSSAHPTSTSQHEAAAAGTDDGNDTVSLVSSIISPTPTLSFSFFPEITPIMAPSFLTGKAGIASSPHFSLIFDSTMPSAPTWTSQTASRTSQTSTATSTTPPSQGPLLSSSTNASSSSHHAKIVIGATVGGVAGLALLIILATFLALFLRRRRDCSSNSSATSSPRFSMGRTPRLSLPNLWTTRLSMADWRRPLTDSTQATPPSAMMTPSGAGSRQPDLTTVSNNLSPGRSIRQVHPLLHMSENPTPIEPQQTFQPSQPAFHRPMQNSISSTTPIKRKPAPSASFSRPRPPNTQITPPPGSYQAQRQYAPPVPPIPTITPPPHSYPAQRQYVPPVPTHSNLRLFPNQYTYNPSPMTPVAQRYLPPPGSAYSRYSNRYSDATFTSAPPSTRASFDSRGQRRKSDPFDFDR